MSSNSTAYKKLNLLEALTKNMCCIANACKDIGISRRTFYHWTETDKEFKEQYEDIQDKLLDFAESMLLKNIAKGDNAAILFYLKSKGKHRGYGDDSSKEQKSIKELTDEELNKKIQQYEKRQQPTINIVFDNKLQDVLSMATDDEQKTLLSLTERYELNKIGDLPEHEDDIIDFVN